MCVCSLSYSACNAHVPYYIITLRSVRLYHPPPLPHFLINVTIYRKMFLNIKCVFWFSLQSLSETFLVLRRIHRDTIVNVHRSSCKVPVILSYFNSNWIFSTDFQKIIKNQFPWKSVQWDMSCSMRTDGRSDRHDETDSRFSQFCERA